MGDWLSSEILVVGTIIVAVGWLVFLSRAHVVVAIAAMVLALGGYIQDRCVNGISHVLASFLQGEPNCVTDFDIQIERLRGVFEAQEKAFEEAQRAERQREADRAALFVREARRRADYSAPFGIGLERWTGGTPGQPGSVFREFYGAPEMVVLPSGSFLMGSPENEANRDDDEGMQRRIEIAEPFALGRYEVTFAQWDACAAEGYCRSLPNAETSTNYDEDRSRDRRSRPVVRVSWNDAQEFVQWLNSRVEGNPYRLPSEAEWEFAARAGTTTAFSTGATISTDQANFNGNATYGGGIEGVNRLRTVPVGSFPANRFGLHDMHGNVLEWVADCYQTSLPVSAHSYSRQGCGLRVQRGGSWKDFPWDLRSAYRVRGAVGSRSNYVGFRIARTLTP